MVSTVAWQPGRSRTYLTIDWVSVAGWVTPEAIHLRFTLQQHLSTSVKLPRNNTLQFSYLKTQTGTTALLSLHGLFFSSKRAERAINGPLADLSSYAAVHGRVYQDVNLNGRFDPGVDQPQANAQVRVDGSRYVVSDANGNFRIESVARGEHSVYLDLLSVRADLTLWTKHNN